MIKTYFVSLDGATGRRAELATRFPQFYENFELVSAVSGNELGAGHYFRVFIKNYLSTGQILSPAEIGCTLSHIEVYKRFLETSEPRALVLEDDVIGSDSDIRHIEKAASTIPELSIFFCGGQDGLVSRKWLLGKTYRGPVYKLHRICINQVWRTCCYVIDRPLAEHLLEKHRQYLHRTDKWFKLIPNKASIFYSDFLKHPLDKANSVIEKEREMLSGGTSAQVKIILFLQAFSIRFRAYPRILLSFLLHIAGFRFIHRQANRRQEFNP